MHQQYEELLPDGCQIIPYDTLFREFDARVPANIYFVVPKRQNPPPGICIDLGMIVVDYSGRGLSADRADVAVQDLIGLAVDYQPAKHIMLRTPGACPLCGRIDIHQSRSRQRATIVGEMEEFFLGRQGNILYRELICSAAIGGKQVYREEYDADQVRAWFEELRRGRCGRCGGEHITNNTVWSDGWRNKERWSCMTCGFWEEKHSWGRTSDGA
jgi:hypothetical protein